MTLKESVLQQRSTKINRFFFYFDSSKKCLYPGSIVWQVLGFLRGLQGRGILRLIKGIDRH